MLSVIPYSADKKAQWDEFIENSKNGTFMLKRDYMEYHADRFQDFSVLIINEDKNSLVAVIPANIQDQNIYSHAGLSYGGIISGEKQTLPLMLEIFDAYKEYLKKHNIVDCVYKTIPHIYHKQPAEEDLYALFLNKAELFRRDPYSVIYRNRRGPVQKRRERGVKKALKNNLKFSEEENYEAFWKILEDNLSAQHGTKPVHSLSEIQNLKRLFPDNIRLFTVSHESNNLLAGSVIYETDKVAHAQYISGNDEGKNIGALDLLFETLISEIYPNKPVFSFGISTEDGGKSLNTGLVAQKESFGARTITQDFYKVKIS